MSNLLLPFFIAEETGNVITLNRTMDRVFSGTTPASGGGNVPPSVFTHEGNEWRLYQVIPFLGQGVVPANRNGHLRVHLRDRSVNRGEMTLASMPDRIEISGASWTGLPWTFKKPTSEATFTNAGSGNAARKSLDYIPDRQPLASASASGISLDTSPQNRETFVIKLFFD